MYIKRFFFYLGLIIVSSACAFAQTDVLDTYTTPCSKTLTTKGPANLVCRMSAHCMCERNENIIRRCLYQLTLCQSLVAGSK